MVVFVLETYKKDKKEKGFSLLKMEVQRGSQTIINYTNKCEIVPVSSAIDEGTMVL